MRMQGDLVCAFASQSLPERSRKTPSANAEEIRGEVNGGNIEDDKRADNACISPMK